MTDQLVDRALAEMRSGLLRLVLHAAQSSGTNESREVTVAPAFTTLGHDAWSEACRLWVEHGQALLQGLPERACPVCEAPKGPFLFTSYDGHDFHACSSCETWFAPRVVDWTLFERFFDRCPEAAALARAANRDRLANQATSDVARFRGYFEELAPLLPEGTPHMRYLDIGCGVGHSLTAACERGLEAHGVEADPDARALALERYSTVVHSPAELSEGRYQLVSLWETLEHLASPADVLVTCADRLAPDGVLALTLPNLDGTSTRLLREECSYVHGGFNQPGHINLFSRSSLAHLLERCGLSLVASDGLYSNDPFALLARILRTSRGANTHGASLDSTLERVLNSLWPAVTLIENLSGRLPILRCFACREDAPQAVRDRAAAWREARRRAIVEAAEQQLSEITDFVAYAEALETAVRERDGMLAALQARGARLRDKLWSPKR
jgi:2-polyprenyl-3-methyl-5-hydroxy-6-metoxy-1,4-benzoquinol methylase